MRAWATTFQAPPLARTIFYGPKPARAIEVLLYGILIYTLLKSLTFFTCVSCAANSTATIAITCYYVTITIATITTFLTKYLFELSLWFLQYAIECIVHPGWLELPLARTIFYGPKPVRAIEVLLYGILIYTILKSLTFFTCVSCVASSTATITTTFYYVTVIIATITTFLRKVYTICHVIKRQVTILQRNYRKMTI